MLLSNLSSLLGVQAPTSNLSVNATLAVIMFCVIQFTAFKEQGILGHLKGWTEPIWILTPLNILGDCVFPLSLSLRLFGNMLGGTIDQILERVNDYEIVVTKELPLPASLIAQFPASVKCICEAGTGYNNIDLKAADEKGIIVCNIPAYSTQRVAQTAIMMLLNLSSEVQKQIRMQERHCYDNFTKHLMVNHFEVNDKVLGIVGYGSIGREVIKIAQALGMKILVYTRTPRTDSEIEFTDLETVLRKCDYLSLHCPLTDETHHLINAETLALMKPSAFIINTSRGALIDHEP